jgi:predicted permease
MPPEWLNRTWLRLKLLRRPRRLERDLQDELAFHVAMREQKYRSSGLSPHEARYLTRRKVGNITSLKERCRDMWSFVSLETLGRDVRFGFRLLVRAPAFTAAVALTLALGIGACLVTGLFFGIVPALKATRVNLVPSLSGGTPANKSSRFGLGKLLVIGQVAMSLLLAVSAGLFVRTLGKLESQDLGFNRDNVLLVNFDPRLAGYKQEQLPALYSQMLDRAGSIPGVRSATLAYYSPLGGGSSTGNWTIVGYTPPAEQHLDFWTVSVGPNYFETLGMPILSGRGIEARDMNAPNPAAVINATAANNFFPNENPIGRKMYSGSGPPGDTPVFEIVGVAADAEFESLRKHPVNMIFTPALQGGGRTGFGQELELRTFGDPRSVGKHVREAIGEIDPNLPVTNVSTLDANVTQAASEARTIAQLAALLGILALLLASVGIYGVMAHGVQRRTKEIGVRVALGAERGTLLWMVMKETLIMAAAGIAIGAPAAVIVAKLMASELYGVRAMDLPTMAIAIPALIVAAIMAAFIPARRATRLDPMEALRHE